MEDRTYITVKELNFYLNRIIDAEELLHNMYVLGETSGCSIHRGNLYCTLKDEEAQISAVCFAVDKTYTPENGEQVLMFGTPTYYEKTGKLSFIARRIEPFGKGKLHLELEMLKKRLLDEGVFNEGHKTPKPKFSKNVCLVTSINGAVVHDIYSTVRKYNNLINICIVNVSVQGKTAEAEIVKGLKLADSGGFDTIILARGGGSFEDLMPFNAESVCRTLYNMDTYVISAVGHETDFTLADYAADARALTPTAAAEMIAFDTTALINDVITDISVVGKRLGNRIKSQQLRATELTRRASFIIGNKLQNIQNIVANRLSQIQKLTTKMVSESDTRLSNDVHKLEALNPVRILKSGYFKGEKDGKCIQSINDLTVGDDILLYSDGGKIEVTVNKIEKLS